jgi:hypothetical protein
MGHLMGSSAPYDWISFDPALGTTPIRRCERKWWPCMRLMQRVGGLTDGLLEERTTQCGMKTESDCKMSCIRAYSEDVKDIRGRAKVQQ